MDGCQLLLRYSYSSVYKGKYSKWKASLPESVIQWKMLSHKLIINKQYTYIYLTLKI